MNNFYPSKKINHSFFSNYKGNRLKPRRHLIPSSLAQTIHPQHKERNKNLIVIYCTKIFFKNLHRMSKLSTSQMRGSSCVRRAGTTHSKIKKKKTRYFYTYIPNEFFWFGYIVLGSHT